ncbi:MAG: transcription factor TFIIIB subunit brf1, partial [Piccolia ochrophora]
MAPTRKAPPMTRLKGVRNPPKRQRPAANIRTCPNAACTQSKIEDHEGQRVCENCGTVISDSNIVSEVQFGETSSGAAVVQGGFVGADQTHAHTMGSAFKRAGGMESREVSEANGKRYINQLAAALHIPPATSDAAFQMYKLASYNNFIQGRRTKNVAAVCLYVACRKQKRNSVMLIDFSDVLNINVFKLGQTFKDFTKELEITGYEPILPENLVYRFATKLEFGRLTEQVAQDAARLVQRMDRDWMTTGRRPSGICGACLILAARMNNFRRTVREVVYIVKVTDMTINRRLEEFKSTESSNLTVEQFRIIQLEKRHDPPAFYEQQNGNTRKRKRVHNVENDEGEGQVETTTNTTQRPLRRDKDGFAIPDIPIDPTLIAASASALSELTSSSPSDKSIVSTATNEPPAKRTRSATAAATATPSSQSSQPKANNNGLGIPPSSQSATTDKENTPAQPQPAPRRPRGRPRKDGTSRPEPPDPTVADLAVEQELENEISQYLNDPTTQEHAEAYSAAQASAAALTHASSSSSSMDIPMSVEIADTEFADDPEVANCVLSPEEREIKERIWVHENRDYLREQQRKLLRRQMEERSGIKKVARKRKNKAGRDGGDGGDAASVASSPGQSVVEVLKQKGFRFSKKINYEAVMETYDRGASRAASREASRAASEVRSPAAPGVAAEPRVEGNTQVDGGDTVVDLAEDDDGSDFTA